MPKAHLVGMDSKVYVLDFFGSKMLRGSGLNVPPSRFLTAYRTNNYNTFLGYYMEQNKETKNSVKSLDTNSVTISEKDKMKNKNKQGIIWGKDPKHFESKNEMLIAVAKKVQLISTANHQVFHDQNIVWKGHQTASQWLDLLENSKFLLGLGDPLLGPSAIDAVSRGCMYINPIYEKPVRVNEQIFLSQHPYAVQNIGEPYVCSYKSNDIQTLLECVEKALNTDLKPFIPIEFTKDAYRKRVQQIFNL